MNVIFCYRNFEPCDSKIRNSIEGIVIKWHYSIDRLVKETSESLFERNSHPTPSMEIKFWEMRRRNIRNIYDQFLDPRIRAIGNILEKIDSVYYSTFSDIFKNIVLAVQEADDITLWIKPLQAHFDRFERDDITESEDKIQPLHHVICLMWAHSKFYGANVKRIIVLFRMINNMIIESATKCLDPGSLFQGEADETLIVLNKIIKLCELHKTCFFEYRSRLSSYVLDETHHSLWTFYPRDAFERFDHYLKRIYEIRDIFEIAYEFFKAEKIEIAGVRGRHLGRVIQDINAEFRIIYSRWFQIQFDPLDPDPNLKDFNKEYKIFKRESKILERRMAAILIQCFDECFTLETLIKFIQICSTLLLRPLIFAEVEHKLNQLMDKYSDDLQWVKDTFDEGFKFIQKHGIEEFAVDNGFPPTSGILLWAKRMKLRISNPQKKFPEIETRSIFENDNALLTQEKYLQMIELIEAFEVDIYEQWKENLPPKITKGMDKYLIIMKDDGFLDLNFDIDLMTALKEIRNLKSLGRTDLPDIANELHENADELWVS